MESISKFKVLVAALAAAVSFAAFGVEWSGEVTPEGDISEPITLNGEVEVTVASGTTITLSGAISDGATAGSIKLVGGGTLALTAANEFTGGVCIEAGVVQAAATGALGSGDVTVCGQTADYTGFCHLAIMGAGKDDPTIVTLRNDLKVTGTSNVTYPALVVYGQNAVLDGSITAAADFIFYDDDASTFAIHDKNSNRYQYVKVLTVTGAITVSGTLGTAGWCTYDFQGKVTTPVFDMDVARPKSWGRANNTPDGNAHCSFRFSTVCDVGVVKNLRHPMLFTIENGMPGALIDATGGKGSVSSLYPHTNFKNFGWGNPFVTHDQTFAGFVSQEFVDESAAGSELTYQLFVSGMKDNSMKVTITGVAPDQGETTKELTSSHQFGVQVYATSGSNVSILLDAYEGFTQTFHGRRHHMCGGIEVRTGTMRVTGPAAFSNAVSLAVGPNGVFKLESTLENALMAVKDLTVEGQFISTSTNVFGSQVFNTLTFGKDCVFSLAEPITLQTKNLTIDGERLPKGTWRHEIHPGIPECVTVEATEGSWQTATSTAIWTGAAGADRRMTTLANWKNLEELPDLKSGKVAVVVESGTGMEYEDGTRVNSIFIGDFNGTDGFRLAPADKPTDTLFIDRSLLISNQTVKTGPVTLSGRIAAPYHIDQGAATEKAAHIFKFYTPSNTDFNRDLILENAVIEKSTFTIFSKSAARFYAAANTTNEFVNHFYMSVPACYWQMLTESRLIFSGGADIGWSPTIYGPGEIVVRNKPWRKRGTTNQGVTLQGVKIHFDVSGCDIGYRSTTKTVFEGGRLTYTSNSKMATLIDFGADHAFTNGCVFADFLLTNQSEVEKQNNIFTNELHSTTQAVEVLWLIGASDKSVINGDEGAMWEILDTGTNRTMTTGGVGYHMKGKGDFVLMGRSAENLYSAAGVHPSDAETSKNLPAERNVDHASTGTIEVSSGRIVFTSDASWRSGKKVIVRDTGRLAISAPKTFGRFAELNLSGTGGIDIPAGVTQTFAAATVNGEPVEERDYTKGDGSVVAPFLLGEGTLRVRHAAGMILMVQ